jgi:3-oxoacyl-[acyl-carrier protein] reductase
MRPMRRLPRRITVNNVQPSPVDTEMNPAKSDFGKATLPCIALNRYGKTEQIASFIAYLAGPEAGRIRAPVFLLMVLRSVIAALA